MPIQIFVVDRQEVVRWGLALACSDAADLEVVGTAESLQDGSQEILQKAPQIIIADLQPSDNAEFALAQHLLTTQPDLKLLVFGADDTRENVRLALNCGASGYITKDASLAEVLVAVRAIHDGRVFISHAHPTPNRPKSLPNLVANPTADRPGIQHSGVDHSTVEHSVDKHSGVEQETLSSREREVVLLLAEGLTNKEVAKQLFLSVKTVETYRARVMKKFQLRGRAELFSFAKRLTSRDSRSEPIISA